MLIMHQYVRVLLIAASAPACWDLVTPIYWQSNYANQHMKAWDMISG